MKDKYCYLYVIGSDNVRLFFNLPSSGYTKKLSEAFLYYVDEVKILCNQIRLNQDERAANWTNNIFIYYPTNDEYVNGLIKRKRILSEITLL